MLGYVVRRLMLFVPMLFVISILVFVLIQLPPGDYLSSYIDHLAERGEVVDEALIEGLTRRYGLEAYETLKQAYL